MTWRWTLGIVSSLALACAPEPSGTDGTGTSTSTSTRTSTSTTIAPDVGTSTTLSTGASLSTTSTDDGAETPDGCGGFDGCPFLDAGGPIGFECDPFLQDCPSGEKCMPYANDGGVIWNGTRCSPLDPELAQVGEACVVEGSAVSGIDNCALGSMCWDVDDATGTGLCEDLCLGSPRMPICDDPGDVCVLANNGAISLCLPQCDPLAQDCDQGHVCQSVNDGFACSPDTTRDTGAHGDPCEPTWKFLWLGSPFACDAGNQCIGAAAHTECASAVGCCSALCSQSDPNADADCASLDPAQTCEAWFLEGMAPVGYEDVGVCAIAR